MHWRRSPARQWGPLAWLLLFAAALLPGLCTGKQFRLDGTVLTVTTDRYEATIEAGCVTSLTNRLTGETLAVRRNDLAERLRAMPHGVGRLPEDFDQNAADLLQKMHGWRGTYDSDSLGPFVEPIPADAPVEFKPVDDGRAQLTWSLDDGTRVTFALAVLPDGGDLQIVARATGPRIGTYGLGVGLMNFSRELNWILPSVETSSCRPADEEPAGKPTVQHWPMPWTSSLVIAESPRGSVALWMTDPDMGDRYLHWWNTPETFDLVFESVNQAPFTDLTTVVSREIHLNVYEGSWVPAARAYRDHWERTFAVKPIEEKPDLPWLKDIRGVISGYTLPPDRHIPYTMTWAPQRWKVGPKIGDGGLFPYDIEKGPELNMIAKTLPAIHEKNAHFMVYLNVYNMNEGHPWAPRLWPDRLQSPFGLSPIEREPVYGAEGSFSVHRASKAWQDLLLSWAGQTYERFGIRGFYLDIGGGKGPNNLTGLIDGKNNCQGEVEMMRQLKARIPGAFLSCEYLNEVTAQVVDFGMYGKDHWFGGSAGQREKRVHPLGGFLYGRYAWLHRGWNPVYHEVLGKLSHPNPLMIETGDITDYAPRDNWWNMFYELQLRTMMRAHYPDVWEPDVRAYYRDREGLLYKVYSEIRPEGRMVRVRADGTEELIYWRIKGRREAAVTPGKGIEGWVAYSGDTAIGLNPRASYLYLGLPRLEDWCITALPEDTFIERVRPYKHGLLVVELGTLNGESRTGRLTLQADYPIGTAIGSTAGTLQTLEDGRVTVPVQAPGQIVFSSSQPTALAWPEDGVTHLAAERSPAFAFNAGNGVRAVIDSRRFGQDLDNRLIKMQPRGDMRGVVEYLVTLPPVGDGESLEFAMTGGMTRDRNRFTGGVWVNGERVLEEKIEGHTNAEWTADLTPWAGQPVLLSVGVDNGYLFRSCYLADPRLRRVPANRTKE